MSFRTRLTLALLSIAVLSLAILGFGVRREMTTRLDDEAARRVQSVTASAKSGIAATIAADHARLQSLASELGADNRFRLGISGEDAAARRWLLDWASNAMTLAGFAVLQLQDSTGRVLSSGQFRNEFDRVAPALPRAIAASPVNAVVVDARTPDGSVRALVTSVALAARGERFTIVGGAQLDSARVARLSTDGAVAARLVMSNTVLPEDAVAVDSLVYIDETGADSSAATARARLVLIPDTGPTRALKAGVVRWLIVTLGTSLLLALVAAGFLGRVISAPITALAEQTARLERSAAMGDLARQVNHDIKNGLTPIRNVVRHLGQTVEREPETLAAIYAERRGTLESSVEYLDELARTYARLSPAVGRELTDPRPVIVDVLRGVSAARVDARLADSLPKIRVDALVLHRVLDNLVSNAVDALEGKPGTITVIAEQVGEGETRRVRIKVSDTGRGMTRAELNNAFNDFYTTKANGTGLGLSVVRRLLTDVGGSVKADTAPGEGSTFTIEIPAAEPE